MTNKTENYQGYEISWQEPPLTSAGYDVNIASDDPDLMAKLQAYSGMKGAYSIKIQGTEAKALGEAKRYIRVVLSRYV